MTEYATIDIVSKLTYIWNKMKNIFTIFFFILQITFFVGCGSSEETPLDDTTAPIFTSANSISVDENQKNVLKVIATDENTVSYSVSTNDSEYFILDDSLGVLTFKVEPNYEIKKEYSLIIIASDGINNIMDVVPVIDDLNTSIDENISINIKIANINIEEVGDSNISSFTIDDNINFTINNTGDIRTKASFDFENIREYNLTIYATNTTGNSVDKNITINIIDIPETELYIKSAIYDNNRTTDINDDKIYLYFNKPIDENSIITSNISENYDINGSGIIGSASTSKYEVGNFNRHVISLNSQGTQSIILDTNSTKVSISLDTIYDTNGSYPEDLNKTMVNEFKFTYKTSETVCYEYNDNNDSNDVIDCNHTNALGAAKYTNGIDVNFTRDDATDIVTDNISGLMWQDNDTNQTSKQWLRDGLKCSDNNTTFCRDTSGDTSSTYCLDLSLGDYNDWRLPSILELNTIIDISNSNHAVNDIFKFRDYSVYVSSTTAQNTETFVWALNSHRGITKSSSKYYEKKIKCVR